MEPLQEFTITFHYTEFYEGRHRSHTHTISVRARSASEAGQMADDYFKDLAKNSSTLFGRQLLRFEVQARSLAASKDQVDPAH